MLARQALVCLIAGTHFAFSAYAQDGGVTVKMIRETDSATIYKVQSLNYPGHLFTENDVQDLAYRVNRRNCNDDDVRAMMELLHKGFQYDVYGSDNVYVGTFHTTQSICRNILGWR